MLVLLIQYQRHGVNMEKSNGSPVEFSASIVSNSKIKIDEAYQVINKVSETLVYLRKIFDGDMDCLLIYLIVLLDDLSSASAQMVRLNTGVSALSISNITGIARETVRRKIGFLVKSGMLRRERNSNYHINNRDGLSLIALGPLELLVAMFLPVRSNTAKSLPLNA